MRLFTRFTLLCSLVLLLASCATNGVEYAEKPSPAYPDFTWDRVPVCLHFSNENDDFTQEEINFMAKHPVVCIEKNQALRKYRNMEEGTLAAGAAIKKVNPNTKVLFYFNCSMDYGEMYQHGLILGDKQHPEWAIKNNRDEYVLVRNKPIRRMYDLSQSEVRDWWVSIVDKWTAYEQIDGVFIDAIPKYAASPENRRKSWGSEKYDAIYAGLISMLDDLKAKFNNERLVIANFLRANPTQMEDHGVRFHDHTDGGMIEHFAVLSGSDKEFIARDMELISDAARRKKVVVVKTWPSFNFAEWKSARHLTHEERVELARKDIVFPLACFLASAGEFGYFCYSWSYRHDGGGLIDYDEYNKPLGKPLGDAVKEGWVYTREFEHASVWVDLESRDAKIDWR